MGVYSSNWQAASASAVAVQPAGASFRFADFVRVARARKGLIVSVAVAAIALTLIVLLLLPTLYSASAVVMLDSRKNNVADQSAVLSSLPTDPATVQNRDSGSYLARSCFAGDRQTPALA